MQERQFDRPVLGEQGGGVLAARDGGEEFQQQGLGVFHCDGLSGLRKVPKDVAGLESWDRVRGLSWDAYRLLHSVRSLGEPSAEHGQAADRLFLRDFADSEALRTGFRRKPDSVPMIADSR